MIIAHGPAGYLCARFLSRTCFAKLIKPQGFKPLYRIFMFAGILGGIFPDFDFIYHIFIDSDRTPHHKYLTHLPVFWLSLWVLCFFIAYLLKHRQFFAVATVFCFSAFVHLVLDTITGPIYWFAPFSHVGVNVFKVADAHFWWVSNYLEHWTILFELCIISIALFQFLRAQGALADIADFLQRHRRLKKMSLRLTVCALGMCLIMIVGSVTFDLNDRIIHKAKQLKHHIVRMTTVS
jgi:inner membrane protein